MTATSESARLSRAEERDACLAGIVRTVAKLTPVHIPESLVKDYARAALLQLETEGYRLVRTDALASLHRLASLALNLEPGKRSPFEQSVIRVMDKIGSLSW
jgi:hypothetical protein